MENVVTRENMKADCQSILNRSYVILREKIGTPEHAIFKVERDKLELAIDDWLKYVIKVIPETNPLKDGEKPVEGPPDSDPNVPVETNDPNGTQTQ